MYCFSGKERFCIQGRRVQRGGRVYSLRAKQDTHTCHAQNQITRTIVTPCNTPIDTHRAPVFTLTHIYPSLRPYTPNLPHFCSCSCMCWNFGSLGRWNIIYGKNIIKVYFWNFGIEFWWCIQYVVVYGVGVVKLLEFWNKKGTYYFSGFLVKSV